MDPVLSILAVLACGVVGGLLSALLRLPRILMMIVLGIVIAPALHPSLLLPCPSYPGSVSGVTTLRSFALLIALARGGLTMLAGARAATLSRLRLPILLLALLPYALELGVEALAARSLLLSSAAGLARGSTPLAVALLAASTWAPLSPSIVVTNMLSFQELGLEAASSAVGTAAPLEIAAALLVYSTLESSLLGQGLGPALAWLPLELLASAALGLAGALAYEAYHRCRTLPRVLALLQAPEPAEHFLVWLTLYLLAYELSGDAGSRVLPHTVGFLAALAMAVATQVRCPEQGAALAAALKPVWAFAERLLFVLTGVVVRDTITGGGAALSWGFAGVLALGSLARLAGDCAASAAWLAVEGAPRQGGGLQGLLAALAALQPRAVLQRAVMLWACTMPKATLQASLGPRPLVRAEALGLPLATATFIAQSSAVSIVACATLGSLLTFSLGLQLARQVEEGSSQGAGGGGKGSEQEGLLAARQAHSGGAEGGQ